MPTKQELMLWLKTYKKENCVPISKMNKNELYEEAKKHGYLQQKYGIKKKTENKTPFTSKQDAKKTKPTMTRKDIFQKIKELEKVDMLKIGKTEARMIADEKKKLFDMLKNI